LFTLLQEQAIGTMAGLFSAVFPHIAIVPLQIVRFPNRLLELTSSKTIVSVQYGP